MYGCDGEWDADDDDCGYDVYDGDDVSEKTAQTNCTESWLGTPQFTSHHGDDCADDDGDSATPSLTSNQWKQMIKNPGDHAGDDVDLDNPIAILTSHHAPPVEKQQHDCNQQLKAMSETTAEFKASATCWTVGDHVDLNSPTAILTSHQVPV